MTLVAAAVCPHPPLLLPAVGVGVELAARPAALHAVQRLTAAVPDLVVVVGSDRVAAEYGSVDSGSLASYGVDLVVPLGTAAEGRQRTLPLALTVGAWLLAEAGWTGDRRAFGVPETMTPADALARGAEIADLAGRVAVLCMGDGSARRSEKAPGWLDGRAEAFDARVSAALGTADLEALAALEPDLARDLLAAGRPSWQVLAGAAGAAGAAPEADAAGDRRWSAELLVDEAPFGVGYFVASWSAGSAVESVVEPAPAA
ncbi:MAG TPA: class III extradiol dioxygenase subunit B-like domain-containing protein [Frankiaceae bacterium]|nr:class III extradiol dioxygenase subunit B-like domain-containing protein [Frankiaceae bacterium]